MCLLAAVVLLPGVVLQAQSNPPREYTISTLVAAGELYHPGHLAMDAAGHLYVPDEGNSVVRRVDIATGKMTVFAGSVGRTYKVGAPGLPAGCEKNGDGCEAAQATFGSPRAVALDMSGNIYISDFWSSTIRRVDAATGKISTYAGARTKAEKKVDWSPTALHNPEGIAVDSKGNLYIADRSNNAIRKVTPSAGARESVVMTTIAGLGPDSPGCTGDGGKATLARLTLPQDVAVDKAGNVYIADAGCRKVRRIAPDGIITTVAGAGSGAPDPYTAIPHDGLAHAALQVGLYKPVGLAFDSAGNLYISDAGFDTLWVYDPAAKQVRLIGGMGPDPTVGLPCAARRNAWGDGCPATQAKLNAGYRVAVDAKGNIYIGEHGMGKAQYPPYTIRVLAPVK
jgi:hypothetical protein